VCQNIAKCNNMRAVTFGPNHHFFGYYDKSPWDRSGRYMLSLGMGFMGRPPKPNDKASIGVIDLQSDCAWKEIGDTRAWNWQQGSMLQWLGNDQNKLIIYNDRQKDQFVAVVKDIHTGKTDTLKRPIYAITNGGELALSLNFSRLHKMRPGYGYIGLQDDSIHDPKPRNDGIYLIDLLENKSRMILSLADVAEIQKQQCMDNAYHWVNHMMFSPNHKRFAFLHRWVPNLKNKHEKSMIRFSGNAVTSVYQTMRKIEREFNKGHVMNMLFRSLHLISKIFHHCGSSFENRMLTANIDGSDAYCFEADVSHYDWLDNDRILAWANFAHREEGYYIFHDKSNQVNRVGKNSLGCDGHCSVFPGTRWLLTDTYPDQERLQKLIVYDLVEDRQVYLGSFYSPPQLYDEVRCDLHPRWSPDGRQVCFDSAHEGYRQVYIIDVPATVDVACSCDNP